MKNKDIKISSNRSFGIVFSVVFFLISFYPLYKGGELIIWSLVLGLVFLILGLMNSSLLTLFNKIWFRFGLFLGKIVSPVVMAIIYFLVITPTSLLLKLFKKDVLNLKKKKSGTYWVEKPSSKSTMNNQF